MILYFMIYFLACFYFLTFFEIRELTLISISDRALLITCFQTKKNTSLNNIGVLLKGDLIDLRACCAHIRHRARNISSPGQDPSN